MGAGAAASAELIDHATSVLRDGYGLEEVEAKLGGETPAADKEADRV
jgi:hypothetical protein